MPNYKKLSEVEELEANIKFESDIYWAVADGDYEVIPVPCQDGSELSDTEKAYIMNLAEKHKVKLLYSVKLDTYSIIFSTDGNKIGILPNNYKYFSC
jgi:hypothetical protein